MENQGLVVVISAKFLKMKSRKSFTKTQRITGGMEIGSQLENCHNSLGLEIDDISQNSESKGEGSGCCN